MADVITRFKLETTQYDSKLRDASKGLAEFAKTASLAGSEFGKFTQSNVETARSFGNIATSANNSKDKVKELVSAFNDVAKIYNTLSKEQQQSDFGKALAESMTNLKGRIAEAKQEMNDTGGIMSQLRDKFVINIDATKIFNAAMTAASAALDVAKDAFFASESTVDEWGRVIDSSKSLYEGFLTALNTGDISGYLSRIDSIVQAARAAYNELDRLGTMKTIQAPQMSAQQTENERMRMMIQTGHYIAPIDGRRASMQNGQLLTPEQIRRIEQQLQGGMQKVVTLVGNEVKQTGRAIDAVYNRQAQELGLSLKEFRKGTSSMAEFDKRMAGYDQYQKWRAAHTTIDQQSGREIVARGNPFAQYAKWGTFRVDGDRYNKLVQLIQQRDQQAGQAYSMQSQAYRTMNRAEGITLRQLMGGGSGGGGRSGGGVGIDFSGGFEKFLGKSGFGADKLKPEDVISAPSIWEQFGSDIAKDMKGTLNVFTDGMVQANDAMNNLSIEGFRKSYDQVQTDIDNLNEKLKQQKMAYSMAGQAAQNFGAALQGIDDPAAKAAGTVMQAVASIALGFAMASSNANTAGTGWGWLAWLAAGTAALATTISTVHSLTGYAEGGEIKGNSYSGDNMMAMGPSGLVGLNAGEIVLNQAQQANVAAGLQNNGMSGMRLQTKVRGTELLVWLDNSLAQSGRGELVTWGQ